MPNGVDPKLYGISGASRPRELDHITTPIVGYTGSLHDDRLDTGLIEFLARDNRFHQVFVGPDYLKPATRNRLAAHKNITLVPSQPYHRLPAFVCHFDVCSIPHSVNPFTNSLDPIKAYEYLAAGKPIVSVDVDGVRPFFELVEIATGHEDFLAKIIMTLEGRHKSDPASRRLFADRNSWRARSAEIMFHIERTLDEKNQTGSSSK